MNHADVKRHLADYLEGDLALDDRAVVDAHLDQCADCAREVSDMQQTIRLLRLLPEPETPPMIAANVMRRIRAGESRPGLLTRFTRGLGAILEPSFVLPASAIAAAAIVVVVLQGPSETGLTNPFASGVADLETANSRDAMARTARVGGLEATRAARPMGTANGTERLASAAAQPPSSARLRVEFDSAGSGAGSGVVVYPDPVLALTMPDGFVLDRFAANTSGSASAGNGGPLGSAGPPQTAVRVDRFQGRGPLAQNVAQPLMADHLRGGGVPMRIVDGASSGGEDPRDAWLARGLENPAEFAGFIANKSLAEQELWVARLCERAEARGLLGELVQSLRQSGDATAGWLADDFTAQAERSRSDSDAAGGRIPSGGVAR